MNSVIQYNNGVCVIGNKNEVYINGKKLPPLPNQSKNCTTINQTVINNHVFVNGYEYKNGEWKRTLRALWYMLF
jgi:hypothetical protein